MKNLGFGMMMLLFWAFTGAMCSLLLMRRGKRGLE